MKGIVVIGETRCLSRIETTLNQPGFKCMLPRAVAASLAGIKHPQARVELCDGNTLYFCNVVLKYSCPHDDEDGCIFIAETDMSTLIAELLSKRRKISLVQTTEGMIILSHSRLRSLPK